MNPLLTLKSKHVITLTVATLFVLTSWVQEKVPTIDRLVAYYPFHGNALDASGNENDGVVRGATLTIDRKGKENEAYSFNGSSNYIFVANSRLLQIRGQITISLWFKTNEAVPFAGLLCKVPAAEPRQGYNININDKNKIRADATYDHSAGMAGAVVSGSSVTDNAWHHMAMVYNGSNIKMFLDGILEDKVEYTTGMNSNNEPLLIGKDPSNWMSHRHYKGSLDDIRIYDRALTNQEITTLFQE